MVRAIRRRAIAPIALGMVLLLVGAASPGTSHQHHPTKLTALNADEYDHFSTSVATDGDTIVVGAPGDDDGGDGAGSAYVFVRTREGWERSAKLTASDAEEQDSFGGSVAIDGDTIVVGARHDDDAGLSSGSAYVFVRTREGWEQSAKLTASDAEEQDSFGSVAIDGDTIVVGAFAKRNAAGRIGGAVYMFARASGGWVQSAEFLLYDTTTDDYLGISVAIDGDTIVAGAPSLDFFDGSPGAVYVYARTSMGWADSAILTTFDGGPWDSFGESVAVSGATIVVGAATEDAESAYVFTRSRSGWDESAKLTASDSEEQDSFGGSVAIDGDTIVVGAWGDDDAGDGAGSVYVFARARSRWVESGKLTAPDASASDFFGSQVAAAGGMILVSASGDDDGGSSSGAAYAFGTNTK